MFATILPADSKASLKVVAAREFSYEIVSKIFSKFFVISAYFCFLVLYITLCSFT